MTLEEHAVMCIVSVGPCIGACISLCIMWLADDVEEPCNERETDGR